MLSFFFLSFLLFLNIANKTFSPNAYFLIFVTAFSLLCKKITQIYSKNSIKSKFSPFFMVLFVSIAVYFLVFIHAFFTQKDTFDILSYHCFSIFIALIFCVISVFVALSVRNSYEKFSAILAKFLIILLLYHIFDFARHFIWRYEFFI